MSAVQQIYRAGGTADANGDLVLTLQVRGGVPALVTQVTAEMPLGAGAVCALRLNGSLVSPLVPTGDAATGDPPIWVHPGDQMTVEWRGAPPGAIGAMLAVYELQMAA